jgi:hypothetical protein
MSVPLFDLVSNLPVFIADHDAIRENWSRQGRPAEIDRPCAGSCGIHRSLHKAVSLRA